MSVLIQRRRPRGGHQITNNWTCSRSICHTKFEELCFLFQMICSFNHYQHIYACFLKIAQPKITLKFRVLIFIESFSLNVFT